MAHSACVIIKGWTSTSPPFPGLTRQSPIAQQQRDKDKLKRDPCFASTANSSTPPTRLLRASLNSAPSAQRQTSSRELKPAKRRSLCITRSLADGRDRSRSLSFINLRHQGILQAICIRSERVSSSCSSQSHHTFKPAVICLSRASAASASGANQSHKHGVASLKWRPTKHRSSRRKQRRRHLGVARRQ